MASLESPQIRVLVDSVQDRDERQGTRREQRPLLDTTNRRHGARLRVTRCCIKSKSALLILFLQLFFTLTYGYLVEFGLDAATGIPYLKPAPAMNMEQGQLQTYATSFYAILAILYLFYPLAGCLADIKCGRYKTVIYSLWIITGSGIIVWIGFVLSFLDSYGIMQPTKLDTIILAIGFGPIAVIGTILSLLGSIAFSANVIQFGMDQLHDSPSEDSVLFIHWFVFTSHLGAAINKFIVTSVFEYEFYTRLNISTVAMEHSVPLLTLILLGVSLGIARCKRHWFLVDSGSRNPYKLVYKVIKFATQHKSPIRRSAFTYCEDELPSRMDLAKDKYGGPFTTEQVEDVKAFLGILQILLTLGSIFLTDIAASNILFKFSNHLYLNDLSQERIDIRWYLGVLFLDFLIGGPPKIITVIFIPLYLCVLRPFIRRCIPGMLKRIGLGMIIRLLSLISLFLIDTIGHILTHSNSNSNNCFISHLYFIIIYRSSNTIRSSIWYVTIPYTLNAISDMLFYIAAYEFICAQSPHAMKGLLIGTFFTVKGVFQLIGVLIILVPFTTWQFHTSFPSCGFIYYLINILIIFVGLFAYSCVSRRYQYRQRDEPDNIYRYAEDYYDRAHDQLLQNNYDSSSDYDNLNVHTIS